MKYALIRMHITSTMSANCRLLKGGSDLAASIASGAHPGAALHLVLHGDSCGSGTKSRPPRTNRGHTGRGANFADLRLLQRVERLRDEIDRAFEHAPRRVVVPSLGTALDLAEQIAECMSADLATGPFQ